MKLNENGDFCLLYVELADEKQTLFETIGMQNRPVVLMLPSAPTQGQSRTRLFQRPEDFSDLKHIKRQTGVSITFLTAGSERLAQMAARYGFPAYPSIDAFAESLTHGRKTEREEKEPYKTQQPRELRTGPLIPTATQIAAIQRSMPTADQLAAIQSAASAEAVAMQESSLSGAQQENYGSAHQPTYHRISAPLSLPPDLAFWSNGQHAGVPDSGRGTPPPPNRMSGFNPETPPPLRDMPFFEESAVTHSALQSENATPRRAATLPDEPYTHHPAWEAASTEEEEEEIIAQRPRSPMPPHAVRPARPTQRTSAQTPRPPLPTHLAQPPRQTSARLLLPEPEELLPPVAYRTPRQKRGISPLLLILSLLILAGAGLGSFVVITRVMPGTPAAVAQQVGQVSFISSEQTNINTSQGIDDEVQINLHNLGQPAAGKSYYAWLLGDRSQTESQSILLGKLSIANGAATLLYPGDAEHTNLLQVASRFLITEEASDTMPLLPSPETSAWRYYGEIPSTPNPSDASHFSFLNHLRHLLADEPVLDQLELQGGLNNWFSRNIQEVLQLSTSGRDQWQNSNFLAVRDQAVRILSYLDGMSFIGLDMPPASIKDRPSMDVRLAGLGLLNVRGSGQNPPSYLDQFAFHLNGLINAPGSLTNVRTIATSIQPVLGYINSWLQNVRHDDLQILAMSNAQLGQQAAFSLLDDMVLQAGNAYTGNTDSATGQFKPGASWMHEQLQAMATINIANYLAGSSVPELGPSSSQSSSAVSPLTAMWQKLLEILQ